MLHRVIEALLFASEGPLSAQELAHRVALAMQLPAGALSTADVERLVLELNQELESSGRPYRVWQSGGYYALAATPEVAQWLERAFGARLRRRLSQAALEVLAIVAYRQPVTRADIDALRGVSSGEVLQSLLDRGLVCVVGHAAAPGRPALYGTTPQFLQLFGLNSLEELPPLEELQRSPALQLFEAVPAEAFDARLQQLRLLTHSDRDAL